MRGHLVETVRRAGNGRSWLTFALAALLVGAPASAANKKQAELAADPVVGDFEVDGNTEDDAVSGIDWATSPFPGGRTDFTDPFGAQPDTVFTGGSKNEGPPPPNSGPNFWTTTNSGSAPQKGDIKDGSIAFRVVNGQEFVYAKFGVLGGTGSVHIDFEFNQSDQTFVNAAGATVPVRTNGDIMIAFDEGGSSFDFRILRWNGDQFGGFFDDITSSLTSASDFAGVLSADETFGEAALNLTVAAGMGNTPLICEGFRKVWMKTRASRQINSSLKDHTDQKDLIICDDHLACTVDTCDESVQDFCVFAPDDSACGDGNECTADSCDMDAGCTHAPLAVGTSCGDSESNGCDAPDSCDASGTCQPNHAILGAVCRSAVDDCDVAETCDGSGADCPPDELQPAGTLCGDQTSNVCDSPNTCDGSGNCEPNHAPATTVCNPAGGPCDVAEFCSADGTCPQDAFQPGSVECRASAGECDAAENCTGDSASCPADGFQPTSVQCRGSAGDCDVAESCTGASAACPGDAFQPGSVECRGSAGDCDLAENCSGDGATCPSDAFKASSVECRASAGDCDVAENCSGDAPACPDDGFQSDTEVCRAEAGDCDVAENCTGDGATCPDDAFKPDTEPCRVASGVCDVAENCTGDGVDCPADTFQPQGTSCEDEDEVACTEDECDGAGHCASTPDDTRCEDSDACTSNACDPDGAGRDTLGCVYTPIDTVNPVANRSARAYGVSLDVGGSELIAPTPDSDDGNGQALCVGPDPACAFPGDPLVEARVLAVEETSEVTTDPNTNEPTGATASASAETAEVKLINTGTPEEPNWLITADLVKAVANCNSDGETTSADSEGSRIEGLTIGGMEVPIHLDTIAPPTPVVVDTPLGTATVAVLEKIRSGAGAGEEQPNAAGENHSDLTVNAIHVRIEDPDGNTVVDLVVSHTECDTSFATVCQVGPQVSGDGFVVGINGVENLSDPEGQSFLDARLAEVKLPSLGGEDEATLKHVGPIGDGTAPLVESNTAFARTEGEVDKANNTGSSHTRAQVEDLDALNAGDGSGPQLTADLVEADCTADSDGTTTMTSRLVGVTLGGEDLCAALSLQDRCEPAPNTDIFPPDSGGAVLIRLNEQIDNSADSGHPDVTVNAIHIFALGEGNPLGLPVHADVIISSAHCDVKPAPANTP